MNIAGYRKWFFLFSGLLVLGSIVLLSVPPALTPGIDFSGGAALTLEYDRDVTPEGVEDALRFVGHDEAVVQATGPRSFFVRVGELAPGRPDSEGNVQPGDRDAVRGALNNLGDVTIVSFDNVSGIIGAENVRRAVISVIVAAVVILFYVTWAFRRVPSPFRYGAAAIVALLHDVLIVFGLFSLLGKTLGLEVNAMFITGVLTTIGYSVNDTIVVFDRVRENVGRFPAAIGHRGRQPQRPRDHRPLSQHVDYTADRRGLARAVRELVDSPVAVRACGRRHSRDLQLDLHCEPYTGVLGKRRDRRLLLAYPAGRPAQARGGVAPAGRREYGLRQEDSYLMSRMRG